MKDIPIIFSAPMVRALLDGRKTMTRRLLLNKNGKPTPWKGYHEMIKCGEPVRIWVREAHTFMPATAYRHDSTVMQTPDPNRPGIVAVYEAGWDRSIPNWRPNIHMHRWASRITLVDVGSKVERLLSISEEDAAAEGFQPGRLNDGFGPRPFGDTGSTIESPGTYASAAGMFQIAWTELHPDWDGLDDPAVVALSFKVVKSNINQVEWA